MRVRPPYSLFSRGGSHLLKAGRSERLRTRSLRGKHARAEVNDKAYLAKKLANAPVKVNPPQPRKGRDLHNNNDNNDNNIHSRDAETRSQRSYISIYRNNRISKILSTKTS